jgi:exopolyphosphatase/guanosine-5'-triphosphate,3'-diphosphate pyrophosphatase
MTERYFPGGAISAESFAEARLAIRLKLRPVKAFFRDSLDIETIGTSGTILATERVARALNIIESHLTPDAVDALIERVIEYQHVRNLQLPGLSERRAQVWPGGLAILAELLRVLRVGRLVTSDGALREGLLYDYIGRLQHEDARERSVQALARRYNVDLEQAGRVADTALRLRGLCADDWRLDTDLAAKVLEWAARLHEIGLDISHEGFDRHGAYVAAYADMPGFPHAEQRLLAFLVGSQRRQIDMAKCANLPQTWREKAVRLAILLRLAVLLNRSRSRQPLPEIGLATGARSIELSFPEDWLVQNPLTVADLERECGYLKEVDYELRFA